MPANDHPLADFPTTKRIDATLAILSASKRQPKGGWSIAELADLCGCSEAAIVARQQAAIERLRPHLGDFLPFLKPQP